MKKDYYIFKSGEIKKDNFNVLFIKDGVKKILPINTINNIFVYGELNLNTTLIEYLGKMNINVHFFNYYGAYRSSLTGVGMQHSGNTHIQQASHYLDNEKRLYIARELIKSAIWGMNKNLQEYNLGIKNKELEKYNYRLDLCENVNSIMGVEGEFRKFYYSNFDCILKIFRFIKRSKRPPLNEINALISFGNSLCYNLCLNAIKETYLNSTISFLHECGDRRHSLCLDLAEIFKPIIIDRIVFKLINNKTLKSSNFEKEDNFCFLKENGRKVFLKEFDDKLSQTFFYRKMNKNISYRNLVKIEAYKLCKHIMNVDVYKSLKIDW